MTEHLSSPLWADRQQAGRALATVFAGDDRFESDSSCIVGLPRGGVPVAAAMAQQLGRPLLTWSVRKIADPMWPEVALGAVAPGGVVVWRNGGGAVWRATTAIRHGWLREQQQELERRQQLYGDPAGRLLTGRHLVVVDDGVATGMTVKAALLSLRRVGPASLVLAVPVVDRVVARQLKQLVDHLLVLASVPNLVSVGEWYEQFAQLTDTEVRALLTSHNHDH
ncbi:phosphoribosyltransferase [Synechococcus sp. RSCCF101]|uniref:phosphoribosyltransferase n=1 Tax=Synechococcus sp. RSCCF101 TaxID=2511069 RepID=UPI0012445863|nr:phosphoribosyltransferase family protein [Synechococcus sp. RSCCF101]QEY31227.1 phosphoribosyltransferase [Synechococcus sp. RSCCF101]